MHLRYISILIMLLFTFNAALSSGPGYSEDSITAVVTTHVSNNILDIRKIVTTKDTVENVRQIIPKIKLKIIEDLTILSAAEIETDKLDFSQQTENRLSPVNKRDLQFGVQLDVDKPDIQSWLVFRDHSSYGKDRFEIYKAYFKAMHQHISVECGIFPLQIGICSYYLNSKPDQPYWNQGILFDTHLTGFSLTCSIRNTRIRLIGGANRTPSGLCASQVEYRPTHHLVLTGSALYVVQDDIFMDNLESAGIELKFRNDHLFLYGVLGFKHYLGEPLLLERKIVPVFGEYAYKLSLKWHLKGACFRVNNKIEHQGTLVEETIYQEINFVARKELTLGIQYERNDIGDFVENNITGILYYHPIALTQTMFKFGYIDCDPRINKIYLGIQVRIRF